MYKIIMLITLIMSSSLSLADRGFSIIQVTSPEQNRVNIDSFTLFLLSDNEEKELTKVVNRDTLFSYDWLEKNQKSLIREIESIKLEIKVKKRGQSGQNGSAEAIIINVSFKEKKIISDLYIYFFDANSVSITKYDQGVILTTRNGDIINNYNINYDQDAPISALYEIKNSIRTNKS